MQLHRFMFAGAISLLLVSYALADLPKPSDVPPLITQLTASSMPAKMRAEAAKELGRIAQIKASYVKDAIPHLLKAAKDKDDNVRKEALFALAMSNPDPGKAVPVMIDGLKADGDPVKIAAAEALSYLGNDARDALPELRKVRDELNKLGMEEKRKKRFVMQAIDQALQSIQNRPKKK